MCDSLGQSDQKVKVWKLQLFGSWIVFNNLKDLISHLERDLEEIQEPEDITVSPVCIYEHELEKLPEFEGY